MRAADDDMLRTIALLVASDQERGR